MKQLTFITAATLLAFATQAQITVTRNDMPVIGDKITQATDTVNITSAGMAGENITWDFSNAVAQKTEEYTAVDVTSTGLAAIYPEANIALTTDEVSFSFFNINENTLEINGVAASMEGIEPIVYDPALVALEFPLNYGDSYTHDYASEMSFLSEEEGIYKIFVRHHATVEKTVDGWGTITTPYGTFQALRVKETENALDSTFFQTAPGATPIFVGVDESMTVSFDWYSNDVTMAVATFNQEGEFTFAKPRSQSSVDEQTKASKLITYPNPVEAGYGFTMQGLVDMDYTMYIFDVNGKLVQTKNVSGLNVNVSTEGLQPGQYFYQMVAPSKIFNGSVIIK